MKRVSERRAAESIGGMFLFFVINDSICGVLVEVGIYFGASSNQIIQKNPRVDLIMTRHL